MRNIWQKNPSKISVLVIGVLTICFVFLLPKANANKYVMTYLYGTGNYSEMIEERGNKFDEVSPSYFDINANGTLKANNIDKSFVTEMKNKNIKVVPFLSNHWDRNVGRNAVNNFEYLSSQIAQSVTNNNLDGVNVDIENLTEADRENYINLVKKIREKMPQDKILVVSVAANPYGINVGWQGSYDYKELGKYADYLMIMAYDEHYEGGTAGAVASIDFVEKSLQYALKNIDKDKIVLGIPMYGRYWNTKTGEGGEAVSIKQINELIKKYESEIIYDQQTASVKAIITIKNTDTLPKIGGKTLKAGKYEFWYENERSISRKLDLIDNYDIKGVGMWKIGLETSETWATIANRNFGKKEIDQTYWAYEYIEFVKEKEIMIGETLETFSAENSLTRAQLATIISRIIEKEEILIEETKASIVEFSDISNHWAKDDIEKLQKLQIFVGYGNNEFRPDNKVSRAEVATIVSRLLENFDISTSVGKMKFKDVSEKYWAYRFITKLTEYEILNGYEDGNFYPENTITRGEMAKIVKMIYEKIV